MVASRFVKKEKKLGRPPGWSGCGPKGKIIWEMVFLLFFSSSKVNLKDVVLLKKKHTFFQEKVKRMKYVVFEGFLFDEVF